MQVRKKSEPPSFEAGAVQPASPDLLGRDGCAGQVTVATEVPSEPTVWPIIKEAGTKAE